VAFQGHVSRHRTLSVGRYTVDITATNSAHQHSNRAVLRFAVVQ
jgi:hypothetical protein